jgi:hypothetical protein
LTAPMNLSSLMQTEVRAQKYQASCVREMVELCGVVCERGYTDPTGRQAIRFADLFNSYRSPIFCGEIQNLKGGISVLSGNSPIISLHSYTALVKRKINFDCACFYENSD